MGKCLFMRKGETHTAPAKSFANCTWAEVIAACQANTVPDSWLVGEQKIMTINDIEYVVDIIGKNHDSYADGSGKAPLTFQLHDTYKYNKTMHGTGDISVSSNVQGWKLCDMRVTNIPTILNLIQSDIKSSIKEVSKITSAGNNSSGLVTTSDKLFLLSEIEIFGGMKYSYEGEGEQYEYYKAGNTAVKLHGTSAGYWWTRSPMKDSAQGYCAVTSKGAYGGGYSTASQGISFAFCF